MRISDWSSDVCSSDLHVRGAVRPSGPAFQHRVVLRGDLRAFVGGHRELAAAVLGFLRKVGQLVGVAGGHADHGGVAGLELVDRLRERSEEHTSELRSLMRISYAVFCLKKKKKTTNLYIIINSIS